MQNPVMDIVYLFKENPTNDSEELRCSLRSLRHLPHGKVFIVGEKPAWATNVTYIPVAQDKTKAQNVAANLSAAVHSQEISDNFIMMNDDFFIMKQLDTIPNLNFGDMKNLIAQYHKRYPQGSEYIDNMTALYDALIARGYEHPISYELHAPMVINKQNVRDMYDALAGQRVYQFRTFYGNYFNVGGESIQDTKIFNDPVHNDEAYNKNPEQYLEQQVLLSTTGGSFNSGFPGAFVKAHFPDKSEYEI